MKAGLDGRQIKRGSLGIGGGPGYVALKVNEVGISGWIGHRELILGLNKMPFSRVGDRRYEPIILSITRRSLVPGFNGWCGCPWCRTMWRRRRN